MNRKEHLIACLAEECSEVIKLCMKSQRFGVRDCHPNKDILNEVDMQIEFLEAVAIMEMLKEEVFQAIIQDDHANNIISAKKDKVNHYMGYAKRVGTLNDD